MKQFLNPMTAAVLFFIAMAFVAEVLSTPVDVVAIIWMLNTTIWVIGHRHEEMEAEKYLDLYESKTNEVERLTEELAAVTEEHKQLLRKIGVKVDD